MAAKILSNYLPEIFALSFFRSKLSVVGVNLTSACNQHCIYCEIGQNPLSPRNGELTSGDLKWIIDQMSINKIPRLAMHGGEPFLFEGITDLVAYAGKKKIRCQITTNGMTVHMLSDDELNILKKYETEINISVDSFQDSIQSYTRGSPAALANALKSIQKLNNKGIPVTTLVVITNYNFHDLYNSFTTAYEKGVKQVLFQPVIYCSNYPDRPHKDEKSQLNVSPDKLDILMDELRKILQFEKRHKIKTNVYRIFPWISYYLKTAAGQNRKWFFDDILDKFICRELYAIINIGYDGGIQACGLLPASVSIINSKDRGLVELWSGATAEIKNELRNGRYHINCNACCHHFSRNMLASIYKHPIKNRAALIKMMPLIFSRLQSGILKKIIYLS